MIPRPATLKRYSAHSQKPCSVNGGRGKHIWAVNRLKVEKVEEI